MARSRLKHSPLDPASDIILVFSEPSEEMKESIKQAFKQFQTKGCFLVNFKDSEIEITNSRTDKRLPQCLTQ